MWAKGESCPISTQMLPLKVDRLCIKAADSRLGGFCIVLGVEGMEVVLEDWASCWARNSPTYLRIA